jgi:ABC-2 type transport system ATP-binding protein
MSDKSVRAKDICKSYKSLFGHRSVVLRDISLEIDGAEIFGILGPNGSGKTTLISIFATLIYPDRGSMKILGLDGHRDRSEIRRRINISTAKPNFPWSLSVKENLRHYGMLYGMHGAKLATVVNDLIDAFELGDYTDMEFEDLSTGLKQRLSLAKAMLNQPQLLFLDEPTTGLDPEIAIKTRQLIRRIHEEQGIAVVMSTHYMPEAEMLCDRVAFLRKGEVVALDTPKNLKGQMGLGERIVVTYDGQANIDALRGLPGVMSMKAAAGEVEITIDKGADSLDGIIKIFSNAHVRDISIKEPDLEDVFLELAR